MDLIDRQAAIEAVQKELTEWEHSHVFNIWTTAEVRFLVAEVILKKIPTAEPRAITPDEFRDKMIEIRERNYSEAEMTHIYMDKFMCETLKLLGYGEGVAVFEKQDKWYS